MAAQLLQSPRLLPSSPHRSGQTGTMTKGVPTSSSVDDALLLQPSPAKKARLSDSSASAAAAALSSSPPSLLPPSVLSPRSEEELVEIFAQSCRCGLSPSAQASPGTTGPHVHLDARSVLAWLASQGNNKEAGGQGGQGAIGPALSAAIAATGRANVCQCIQLPRPRAASASAAASSTSAAAGSHKRSRVSPPGTPLTATSTAPQSLTANVVKPLLCGSPTGPRSIVRVRKHHHQQAAAASATASAASAARNVSPCSLTVVAMPEDEDGDRDDEEDAGDDDHSTASSMPVSPTAGDAHPTAAEWSLDSPLLVSRSAAGAVAIKSVTAASAAAASAAASPLLRSPQMPLQPSLAVSGCGNDGADDDAAAVSADAASLAEIRAIEEEERESELSFIMNELNQTDSNRMPYIY